MRVAVFGASGLVGTILTERLEARGREVVPIIHGSGSAWRLARTGRSLTTADLLDPSSVRVALRGASHIVNCSRGDRHVMHDGLRNLLREARRAQVQKFVHLSSVAVYGDPPRADAAFEDGRTSPAPGSYGAIKLEQDLMVKAAAKRGVPSVILCPPNVSGPHSYFLLQLRQSLGSGRFGILNDGSAHCALVDVENLAYGIERALDHGSGVGDRYFITDDEDISWADVIREVQVTIDQCPVPRQFTADEIRRGAKRSEPKPRLLRSLMHPLSGGVRAAMRSDPRWSSLEEALKKALRKAPGPAWSVAQRAIVGPIPVPKVSESVGFDFGIMAQQLRGVRHSCQRARDEMGYAPIVSCGASMRAFQAWCSDMLSVRFDDRALLRELR